MEDLSKTGPNGTAVPDRPSFNSHNYQPATLGLHADDYLNVISDVAPPIHVSTTYRYAEDPQKLVPFHERVARGPPLFEVGEHIYSREASSGSTRIEAILSSLLHNPSVVYASGLSAFNAVLTMLVPKKVAIGDGYHGCHGVLEIYKRLTGCQILPLDGKPEDLDAGDLLWLETPINPTGRAFNIQHYADIAHSRGAYLGVDATFGPPPLQDPFKHGADVVMHSGTKFFGGHSDMLCGVLAVKDKQWAEKLHQDRLHLGSVMGGLESWLGIRSLRTLELRVTRQSENAQRIVDALDGALTGATVGTGLSQSDVDTVKKVLKEVLHSSLQTEDCKTWLKKQMPVGHGSVFSIVLHSGEMAKRLPSKLRLFHHATSLGGVESLIEWRTMSDDTVGRDLLRISVGIEDDRDLLDDLLQAFRSLAEELQL